MSSARTEFAPGIVWSWWDVKEVLIRPLLSAVSAVDIMVVTLNGQDIKSVEHHSDGSATITYVDDPVFIRLLVENAEELSSSCRELGLPVTLLCLDDFRQALLPAQRQYLTYEDIRKALGEIQATFKRELKSVKILSLDSADLTLYEAFTLFGPNVHAAFPSARDDIAEAGRCLALDRGTACVFHLMRALESACQVVASKIGATITDGGGKTLPWGVIADNMKTKIDAMAPKGGPDQTKWYRVQSFLVVVNRAWRVPTNHPKEHYTTAEARMVFDAAKAFMQELAPLA